MATHDKLIRDKLERGSQLRPKDHKNTDDLIDYNRMSGLPEAEDDCATPTGNPDQPADAIPTAPKPRRHKI